MKIFRIIKTRQYVEPEALKDERFIKMAALLKWRFIINYISNCNPYDENEIYHELLQKYSWMGGFWSFCSFCEAFKFMENYEQKCDWCPLWRDTTENTENTEYTFRCCDGYFSKFEKYTSKINAKEVLKEIQSCPLEAIKRSIEAKER